MKKIKKAEKGLMVLLILKGMYYCEWRELNHGKVPIRLRTHWKILRYNDAIDEFHEQENKFVLIDDGKIGTQEDSDTASILTDMTSYTEASMFLGFYLSKIIIVFPVLFRFWYKE